MLRKFLVDVISESIAKGLVAFWREINQKHTAEREEVTDEDLTRAANFRIAVGELQRSQGNPESDDTAPTVSTM